MRGSSSEHRARPRSRPSAGMMKGEEELVCALISQPSLKTAADCHSGSQDARGGQDSRASLSSGTGWLEKFIVPLSLSLHVTFQTSLWGRGSSPGTLLRVSRWCQTLALGHRGPSSEMCPVPHGGSPASRHGHVRTHTLQKLGQAEGGGGCRKDKWISDTCIQSPVVPRLRAGCKALKTGCHPPGGTPPAQGRPQGSCSPLCHSPLSSSPAHRSRQREIGKEQDEPSPIPGPQPSPNQFPGAPGGCHHPGQGDAGGQGTTQPAACAPNTASGPGKPRPSEGCVHHG